MDGSQGCICPVDSAVIQREHEAVLAALERDWQAYLATLSPFERELTEAIAEKMRPEIEARAEVALTVLLYGDGTAQQPLGRIDA